MGIRDFWSNPADSGEQGVPTVEPAPEPAGVDSPPSTNVTVVKEATSTAPQEAALAEDPLVAPPSDMAGPAADSEGSVDSSESASDTRAVVNVEPPAALTSTASDGSGYRSYGDPARLTPIPRAPQPSSTRDGQGVPPDTAIEWFDAATMAVRGVSVRGHSHRYLGEPRQDAFAIGEFGGFLWLAVADGVGSRPHSHVGASIATLTAIASRELVSQAEGALSGSPEATDVTMGMLAAEMEAAARRESLEPDDMSCTLVVAAVRMSQAEDEGAQAVLWQLGDSCFLVDKGGDLIILNESGDEDALINTSTAALPRSLAARRWVIQLQPGDTLALATDGVSNLVAATPDYARDLSALWSDRAPSPSALLSVLDASVRSFDDDRTFVAIKVGRR